MAEVNNFKMGERFGSLEAEVKHVSEDITEMKTEVRGVKSALDDGLRRVHERIDGLKKFLLRNGNCGTNQMPKLKKWQIIVGIIVALVALFGGVSGVINLAKAMLQSLGG